MDIYQRYLSFLLWLRLPRAAFAVSKRWEDSENMDKVEAALELQRHLIEHHGYFECPHCHWATRKAEEHVTNPVHPCSLAGRDTVYIEAIREGFANQKPEMETRPVSQEPPMQSIAHH